MTGYDLRQSRLSHSRWSPEYHGCYLVALDQPAEHLALSHEMLLSHIFIEALRAQSRCQRLRSTHIKK